MKNEKLLGGERIKERDHGSSEEPGYSSGLPIKAQRTKEKGFYLGGILLFLLCIVHTDSSSALLALIILLKQVSRRRCVLGQSERPTHRRSPKHTSSWPFQVRETGSHVGRLFTGISFLMRWNYCSLWSGSFRSHCQGSGCFFFCSASLCWTALQSNLIPDVTDAQQQKKKPFLAVTSSFKEGLIALNIVIGCGNISSVFLHLCYHSIVLFKTFISCGCSILTLILRNRCCS